jgi:hypothetical protein
MKPGAGGGVRVTRESLRTAKGPSVAGTGADMRW